MENAPDHTAKIARIAELNDELRANITRPSGHNRITMTAGIAAMIGNVGLFRAWRKRAELIRAVRDFDRFEAGDQERDFGAFDWEGTRCFWKIDYYEPSLEWGSNDPADAAATARVLTILRADEY